MPSNVRLLDQNRPEVAVVMAAMLKACEAVNRRSWSHPHEPTSEAWWADVLADPRARRRETRATDLPLRRAFYSLADETRPVILVACSKCDWKAAYRRDDLIAQHGMDRAMPSLLSKLAAPNCPKTGLLWDHCGVHFADPIDGGGYG
jgi:hypothetical protein